MKIIILITAAFFAMPSVAAAADLPIGKYPVGAAARPAPARPGALGPREQGAGRAVPEAPLGGKATAPEQPERHTFRLSAVNAGGKWEVECSKRKPPKKEKAPPANVAEVLPVRCNSNIRSLNSPRRSGSRRRMLRHVLVSAPECRSSATSNAMVQRRSSAESKVSCAPLIF